MHTPSRAISHGGAWVANCPPHADPRIRESVSAGRSQAYGIDIETSPASLERQHATHCKHVGRTNTACQALLHA
jgi:hypothetical protein